MKNLKKALIVDGNSIVNRAFYGIKNMATNQGFPTGAIYGFLNIINSVMDELNPEYIVVCFDLKAPTFRHKQYEGYKATRKGMPEELVIQLPEVKNILGAMKIAIEELQGFEADDLLGAISKQFNEENVFAYLLTGDKDSLQLVDDMTSVYYHGTKNKVIYDVQAVFDDLGVYPNRVADLKAIMGDTSDNIPGVSGIGAVGAKKLISEFDNLENLIEHSDEIKAKRTKELFQAGVEQAVLSKQLATIVRDLPVEIDISEYERQAPNYELLMELYKKFSLNKFLSQLIKQKNDMKFVQKLAVEQDVKVQGFALNSEHSNAKAIQPSLFDMQLTTDCKLEELDASDAMSKFHYIGKSHDMTLKIADMPKVEEFIASLTDEQELFITHMVDVENIFDSKLPYIALMKCSGERIFIADFAVEVLKQLIAKRIKFIGHGFKPLLLVLRNLDLSPKLASDLEIAMYLCEANRNSFEPHDLAIYIGSEVHIAEFSELLGKGKSQKTYSQLDLNVALDFLNKSLELIADAHPILRDKLHELEMMELYQNVELPLIEVLCELQYNGISVDMAMLDQLDELISAMIITLEAEIYEMAGEEFNISSPKQLSVILFEKLGLSTPKKNKTGYSTSHEVLIKLMSEHEIIDKIIDYRRYTKLKSTYVEGLKAVINPFTKKIHSSFNQTVAATGRLSSTEPNLQNIPIRLQIGREFRKVFVASDKHVLVDADYSQIELRILAHMSADEKLTEAYEKHIDVHTMTASQVFDLPIDEVDADSRSRAKAVNFGIVYGMSDFGLSENLKIPIKTAGLYIRNYFAKYPKVKQFMDNAVEECKLLGYSQTLLGRKRYIPEIHSKNYNVRGYGQRMAMNTPIQGSAADIIKIAMVNVYRELKARNLKSKLILQVHDELIIEAHESEVKEVKRLLKEAMEGAFKLNVELEVDMNVGKSWFEAK